MSELRICSPNLPDIVWWKWNIRCHRIACLAHRARAQASRGTAGGNDGSDDAIACGTAISEPAVRGESAMTNIPTELLRTLVAVVDLRSFTKAAQSLGVTQPAVSAQIKRLQGLLGADLLDKSAPGVSLTSAGELVVNYARRLLSINDQILDIAGPRLAGEDDADRRDRRLHRGRHRARATCARAQPARSALRALQRQDRRCCCATCAKASRPRDLGVDHRPDASTRGITGPSRWSGCARRRRVIDPEPSGAAGVLWRGLPVQPRQP